MKYIVFTFFIFCLACKPESNSPNLNQVERNAETKQLAQQVSDVISLETLRDFTWTVEIVLDNGKINQGDDWKGSTLSFNDNGKYSWEGERINNSGQFTLDTIKNIIQLEAGDPLQNSEWSIKHKKNVMVWIGTPKYGHHALQMKLMGKTK